MRTPGHIVRRVAMKRGANWLAWMMRGVLGQFAGAVAGLILISRGRSGLWLDASLILPFVFGAALIDAGLGSRFGDRLWVGDNYRMIAPDEPEQSNLSDWLSWCLVAAGTATCTVTVFRQLQIL